MPARNLLTAARIAAEKPGDRPRKVSDGSGLFLLVQPNGSRWWRFKYRGPKGERLLSLGVYPDTSLSLAREKADEARQLLAQGLDPSEVRKARKSDEKAAVRADAEAAERAALVESGATVPGTFKALAEEFMQVRGSNWSRAYRNKVEWVLRTWLFPEFGGRPVCEVTAPLLLEALRKPEALGLHETAHKARTLAGEVMRFGIATGQAEADPAAVLRGALKPTRSRHLSFPRDPAVISGLLRAMWGYAGSPVVHIALRLTPQLFVRPGELRAAEWAEFDLASDTPTWTIPAEKMKARRPHVVPLSTQAATLLRELQPLTGGGRYVFPSLRSAERCMSGNTVNAALRALGYSGDVICAHGFRHLASTLLNELGWPGDVVELQLAHKDRDAIRAVYNHSQRIPERRRMMQAWADHLDALREGAQVIPFRKGAA